MTGREPVPAGLLMSAFDISGADEAEFNDWYDHEHVPERIAIEGFVNAERWVGVANRSLALATYDLENPQVLDRPEYLAIAHDNMSARSKRIIASCRRLIRFHGEQIYPGRAIAPAGTRRLLVSVSTLRSGSEDAYRDWFGSTWLPLVSDLAGVLGARLFRSLGPHPVLAELHHFGTAGVTAMKAWQEASEERRRHLQDAVVDEWLWQRYEQPGAAG